MLKKLLKIVFARGNFMALGGEQLIWISSSISALAIVVIFVVAFIVSRGKLKKNTITNNEDKKDVKKNNDKEKNKNKVTENGKKTQIVNNINKNNKDDNEKTDDNVLNNQKITTEKGSIEQNKNSDAKNEELKSFDNLFSNEDDNLNEEEAKNKDIFKSKKKNASDPMNIGQTDIFKNDDLIQEEDDGYIQQQPKNQQNTQENRKNLENAFLTQTINKNISYYRNKSHQSNAYRDLEDVGGGSNPPVKSKKPVKHQKALTSFTNKIVEILSQKAKENGYQSMQDALYKNKIAVDLKEDFDKNQKKFNEDQKNNDAAINYAKAELKKFNKQLGIIGAGKCLIEDDIVKEISSIYENSLEFYSKEKKEISDLYEKNKKYKALNEYLDVLDVKKRVLNKIVDIEAKIATHNDKLGELIKSLSRVDNDTEMSIKEEKNKKNKAVIERLACEAEIKKLKDDIKKYGDEGDEKKQKIEDYKKKIEAQKQIINKCNNNIKLHQKKKSNFLIGKNKITEVILKYNDDIRYLRDNLLKGINYKLKKMVEDDKKASDGLLSIIDKAYKEFTTPKINEEKHKQLQTKKSDEQIERETLDSVSIEDLANNEEFKETFNCIIKKSIVGVGGGSSLYNFNEIKKNSEEFNEDLRKGTLSDRIIQKLKDVKSKLITECKQKYGILRTGYEELNNELKTTINKGTQKSLKNHYDFAENTGKDIEKKTEQLNKEEENFVDILEKKDANDDIGNDSSIKDLLKGFVKKKNKSFNDKAEIFDDISEKKEEKTIGDFTIKKLEDSIFSIKKAQEKLKGEIKLEEEENKKKEEEMLNKSKKYVEDFKEFIKKCETEKEKNEKEKLFEKSFEAVPSIKSYNDDIKLKIGEGNSRNNIKINGVLNNAKKYVVDVTDFLNNRKYGEMEKRCSIPDTDNKHIKQKQTQLKNVLDGINNKYSNFDVKKEFEEYLIKKTNEKTKTVQDQINNEKTRIDKQLQELISSATDIYSIKNIATNGGNNEKKINKIIDNNGKFYYNDDVDGCKKIVKKVYENLRKMFTEQHAKYSEFIKNTEEASNMAGQILTGTIVESDVKKQIQDAGLKTKDDFTVKKATVPLGTDSKMKEVTKNIDKSLNNTLNNTFSELQQKCLKEGFIENVDKYCCFKEISEGARKIVGNPMSLMLSDSGDAKHAQLTQEGIYADNFMTDALQSVNNAVKKCNSWIDKISNLREKYEDFLKNLSDNNPDNFKDKSCNELIAGVKEYVTKFVDLAKHESLEKYPTSGIAESDNLIKNASVKLKSAVTNIENLIKRYNESEKLVFDNTGINVNKNNLLKDYGIRQIIIERDDLFKKYTANSTKITSIKNVINEIKMLYNDIDDENLDTQSRMCKLLNATEKLCSIYKKENIRDILKNGKKEIEDFNKKIQEEMKKKIRMFSMFYNIIKLFKKNRIFKDNKLINSVKHDGNYKQGSNIDVLLSSLNKGALSAAGLVCKLTTIDTCLVEDNLCFDGCDNFYKTGKSSPSMFKIEQACQACKNFIEQGILKLHYLMKNDDVVSETGIAFNKNSADAIKAREKYKNNYIKMLEKIYCFYLNDSYNDSTKNENFLNNEVEQVVTNMYYEVIKFIKKAAVKAGFNENNRTFTFDDLNNHGYNKLNTMANGNMNSKVVSRINSFVTYISDIIKNTAGNDAVKYYYRRKEIIDYQDEQKFEKFKDKKFEKFKEDEKFKKDIDKKKIFNKKNEDLDIKKHKNIENIENISKKNVMPEVEDIDIKNIKDIKNKSKLLNNKLLNNSNMKYHNDI